MISVDFIENEFIVSCPAWDNERIKSAPGRKFDGKKKVWYVPSTKAAAVFLHRNYSEDEQTDAAIAKIKQLKEIKLSTEKFPSWFKFKNEPMSHQVDALDHVWGNKEIALFMEMRTGKTFVTINWGAALAMEGKINSMVVIVPNMITLVWEDELKIHCPIPVNSHVITAGSKKKTERFIEDTDTEGMKVLIVAVEAFSQGNAWEYVKKFCLIHKNACIVDESSRIKNNRSIRTDRVIEIGGLSEYRAILTGTPITQGIQDLYSQFRFLNWEILGYKSEYSFKHEHCIMGGFEGRKIVGYRRVSDIIDATKPYVYQCKAVDVIDLPPMVYEYRIVEPNTTQKRLLKELGDPFMMATNIGDKAIEVETVLERMTRFQQIAGGLFPYEEDGEYKVMRIKDKNPKLNALMETIEELPEGTKMIIWARFRPEIELISDALAEKYGQHAVVEFHGGIEKEQRRKNIHRFQQTNYNNLDKRCLFLVTNQQSAGMGLELSAASVHLFYSQSFSYEERMQAEARTNSKHQKANSILYVDFRVNHKIDKMIATAIKTKKSMAEYVRDKMSDDKLMDDAVKNAVDIKKSLIDKFS